MTAIIIQFSCSFAATVAFSIITNVPRKVLWACGLTGACGWLGYWYLSTHAISLGLANFVGAIVIGCLSIFFSRKLQMPMIIFNIPSLVPLVPGGPAYAAVRELISGSYAVGMQNVMVVIITAGSIAVGFMVTNLLEKLFLKYRLVKQQAAQRRKN